ncbi:hypothetical protein LTR56_008302 [Elasticomyces elasticus]|nr:hypothetical protein LTR56_008302 [Elasticomyces elasticus]KAK3661439.1 hypothetical protein LTR22_007448 [Elasticomyces elasticus]KAK4926204.1 hypothetical protein LTR49_006909 [Elasticomyces elasticus]KAK5750256.1 hypothetical protein LTS12_019673 [Elasticomyces elasticus]
MDTLMFIAHLNNTQFTAPPPAPQPSRSTMQPAVSELVMTLSWVATFIMVLVVIYQYFHPQRISQEQGSKSTLPMPLPIGAADLFRTEQYSDIYLTCGKRAWNLHKSIICPQSVVFTQMCERSSPKVSFVSSTSSTNPMLTNLRKAQKLFINLLDDEINVVAAMVYYLYHGEYDVAAFTSEYLSTMELHVKLYFLACKYSVDFLPLVASSKLRKSMKLFWNTDGFAKAVAEIYARTGRNHHLRKMAVSYTAVNAPRLFAPVSTHAKFNHMARSTPEFAADVTAALASSEFDDVEAEIVDWTVSDGRPS